MCRVVGGISSRKGVIAPLILHALLLQQHGGRIGTGFAFGDTHNGKPYDCERHLGPASSWFGSGNELEAMKLVERYKDRNIAIGHNRYATKGARTWSATQPHGYTDGGNGVFIASNGDIPLCDEIREDLVKCHGCKFASDCDAEVIANMLGLRLFRSKMPEIKAFGSVVNNLSGSFSAVAMTPSGKLAVMRDKWGFHPLFWGRNEDGFVATSETIVLQKIGIEPIEVVPGSVLLFSDDGSMVEEQFCDPIRHFCLIELLYFSRPESYFVDKMIAQIRYEFGYQAGIEWLEHGYPEFDMVVPIPESGRPAAEGFSASTGVGNLSAIIKDRYGDRNFQRAGLNRVERIQSDFSVTPAVKGKRVALVDDTVIRADQARKVVQMTLDAGALEVYVISTGPPYRHACRMGINTPDPTRLVANGKSMEEIRQAIPGLSWLHYLSLKGIFKVLGSKEFCTGCFTGEYPIPVPANGSEV